VKKKTETYITSAKIVKKKTGRGREGEREHQFSVDILIFVFLNGTSGGTKPIYKSLKIL
jgi:hypothetical protein